MHIWTDGGCRDNGSANALGAWAFVAGDLYEESGAVENTTNNRTELQAIINAIRYAASNRHKTVTIHTDSQLSINCATGRWKRKANLDLWADYKELTRHIAVTFVWVPGHSGDPLNDRCDKLCTIAMSKHAAAQRV